MNESESPYKAIFLDQLINSLEYINETIYPAMPLDVFSQYRDHALGVLQLSLERSGTWEHTRPLLLRLATLMEQSGQYELWLPFLEEGIRHATAHEAWETLGELEFQSGFLCQLLGRHSSAEQHFRASSHAFRQYGNPHRVGRGEMHTAIAMVRQHEHAEGQALAEQSLPLVAGNPLEEGYYYYAHYLIAAGAIRYPDAREAAARSLELWRQTKQPRYIGWGLANLGLALFQNGQSDLAETYLVEALTYLRQVNDPSHISIVQMSLGNLYLMREDYVTALEWYLASESMLRSMQNVQNIAQLTNNIGMVYHGLQKWDVAQAFYEESIERYRSLRNHTQVANGCDNLALTFAAQQMYTDAYVVLDNGLYTLGQSDTNNAQTSAYTKMLNETRDSIQILQAAEAAAEAREYEAVISLLKKPIADLRATPTGNNYSFFYSRFMALYDQAKDANS